MSTVEGVVKKVKKFFGEKKRSSAPKSNNPENTNAFQIAFQSLAAVKKAQRKNKARGILRKFLNTLKKKRALAHSAASVAVNRAATRTKGRSAAFAAANVAAKKIATRKAANNANERHQRFLKKMGPTLFTRNAIRSPGAPGSTRKASRPFRP